MHRRSLFEQQIDSPLADWVARQWHRSDSLDAIAVVIARWTPLVMLASIAAASFGFGLSSSPHHQAMVRAVQAVLSAVIARLANEPLTRWVSRARPFERSGLGSLLWHAKGGGFPSNHATGAFALAIPMASIPGYGPCLLVLAVLLAISRVYSGLHYLSDVIAGALNGTFWALLLGRVISVCLG